MTPYGGGDKPDAHGKAQEYNGFYSLPEIGERVLVEFLGEWDSEAVIAGTVREHPVSVHHNPSHAKRWRTPAGNEISLVSRSGQSVLLTCGDGGAINASPERCPSEAALIHGQKNVSQKNVSQKNVSQKKEYRTLERRCRKNKMLEKDG